MTQRIGCVIAQNLTPKKARILLMLAMLQTRDQAALQSYFDR
jgi:L-asparaginase